jgi:transcriptional antiterminator RfaH
MKWYVVQTKVAGELAAERNLNFEGFTTFFPLGRQDSRTFALFPGYGFIQLGEEHDWSKVKTTPKVIRLVPGTDDTPAQLDDSVIKKIREMAVEGAVELDPIFAIGEKVKVKEGPFHGIEGIVKCTASQRVNVLFDLMGGVSIEIQTDNLYRTG